MKTFLNLHLKYCTYFGCSQTCHGHDNGVLPNSQLNNNIGMHATIVVFNHVAVLTFILFVLTNNNHFLFLSAIERVHFMDIIESTRIIITYFHRRDMLEVTLKKHGKLLQFVGIKRDNQFEIA